MTDARMTKVRADRIELGRERTVQQLACPQCAAEPGHRCQFYGKVTSASSSHPARYRAAVAAGLLPPLPYLDSRTTPAQPDDSRIVNQELKPVAPGRPTVREHRGRPGRAPDQ